MVSFLNINTTGKSLLAGGGQSDQIFHLVDGFGLDQNLWPDAATDRGGEGAAGLGEAERHHARRDRDLAFGLLFRFWVRVGQQGGKRGFDVVVGVGVLEDRCLLEDSTQSVEAVFGRKDGLVRCKTLQCVSYLPDGVDGAFRPRRSGSFLAALLQGAQISSLPEWHGEMHLKVRLERSFPGPIVFFIRLFLHAMDDSPLTSYVACCLHPTTQTGRAAANLRMGQANVYGTRIRWRSQSSEESKEATVKPPGHKLGDEEAETSYKPGKGKDKAFSGVGHDCRVLIYPEKSQHALHHRGSLRNIRRADWMMEDLFACVAPPPLCLEDVNIRRAQRWEHFGTSSSIQSWRS